MDQGAPSPSRAEETLRREASAWFARMRGPEADHHRGAFDAWRTADPRRQAAYDRLIQRWDDAAVLARFQPARLGIGQGRLTARRQRSGIWALGWGGLAAGCAGLALIAISATPAGLAPWPSLSILPAALATRVGEIRTVRLSDGSSLTLDTDTAVAPQFTSTLRRVRLLRGRARFDVAHDPARPFVVTAEGGAVAARGTLFDVSLSPDKEVSVTLLRGAVEIEPPSGVLEFIRRRHPALRLAPGQQLAYGRAIATPKVQQAKPTASLWPSGLLSFQDTPLAEVLTEANRYVQNRIVLSDPTLGAMKVSGVFRASAAQALAQSLATAFNLQVSIDPKGDYVLSPILDRLKTTARVPS